MAKQITQRKSKAKRIAQNLRLLKESKDHVIRGRREWQGRVEGKMNINSHSMKARKKIK